jgi:uncharacterized small protein (DUF1192 family)
LIYGLAQIICRKRKAEILLERIADFILSRETAMNEKIVELQEEIERLKFWIPKQDRAY